MSAPGAIPGDVATAGLPAGVRSRLAAVPLFAGRRLDVVPLVGGMTNQSCRVVVDGREYVARLSGPSSALLGIDRTAEYRDSVAAAASGAAPPVAAYAPAADVLVVDWIRGRTLGEADLADAETLRRVLAQVRTLHAGPRFTVDVDVFDLLRRYLGAVSGRGFRVPPGFLDRLPVVDGVRRALAAHPQPSVPCHNDLVPANLIDDGRRIWIVDYEYAGNNDPCFELGNLWSEAGLPAEALGEIVRAYYGTPRSRLVARARLFGIVADCVWVLWAGIQEGVSPLDVDFRSWGEERFERAAAELDGPGLPRILRQACAEERNARG